MFGKDEKKKGQDVKQEQATKAAPQQPVKQGVKEEKSTKPQAPAQLSQREGTFLAVMAIFKEAGVNFTPGGNDKATAHMTAEMRKKINLSLCEQFRAKKIAFRETPENAAKLADDKLLFSYCSGLLGNWLRRDPRLNGVGEKKSE